MRKKIIILFAFIFTLAFVSLGFAASDHGGMSGSHDKMEKKDAKSESSHQMHPATKEASHDGIKAKFHLMTLKEHMKEMEAMSKEHKMDMKHAKKGKDSNHTHKTKNGSKKYHNGNHEELSHHIALELADEKTKKSITDAKIDLTITSPSGKAETKKLKPMKMGSDSHFYLDADLKEKGNYMFEFFVNIKDNETKFSFEEKIQ